MKTFKMLNLKERRISGNINVKFKSISVKCAWIGHGKLGNKKRGLIKGVSMYIDLLENFLDRAMIEGV